MCNCLAPFKSTKEFIIFNISWYAEYRPTTQEYNFIMDQEKKLQFTYSDDSEDDDSAGLAACSANRVWTEEVPRVLILRRIKS